MADLPTDTSRFPPVGDEKDGSDNEGTRKIRLLSMIHSSGIHESGHKSLVCYIIFTFRTCPSMRTCAARFGIQVVIEFSLDSRLRGDDDL